MKLNKIEPNYLKKTNPRVGLITLASDFRIEKDFNNVIYGKEIDLFSNRETCDWISVDHKEFSGTYDSFPTRDLLSTEINENYIVELYSR